jgi:hypothetical protein
MWQSSPSEKIYFALIATASYWLPYFLRGPIDEEGESFGPNAPETREKK